MPLKQHPVDDGGLPEVTARAGHREAAAPVPIPVRTGNDMLLHDGHGHLPKAYTDPPQDSGVTLTPYRRLSAETMVGTPCITPR